jgi:hypothetical protein
MSVLNNSLEMLSCSTLESLSISVGLISISAAISYVATKKWSCMKKTDTIHFDDKLRYYPVFGTPVVIELTNKTFTEQAGMILKDTHDYYEEFGPDQKSMEYTFKDVTRKEADDIAEKFGLVYIYDWNEGEKAWAVNELSRINECECMAYDEEDETLTLFGWSTKVK